MYCLGKNAPRGEGHTVTEPTSAPVGWLDPRLDS